MASNFEFLNNVDKNLYKIIVEAEKLYQDEYFEQAIVQVRRFGEQLCKEMLAAHKMPVGTFDEMIETLKDNSQGSIEEKEFIQDLYFIKKNGNAAAHSNKIDEVGMVALECIQRAFEVSINYCVHVQGGSRDILKKNFDTELLVTGKKSKKSLKEKYEEAKAKETVKKERKTKVKQETDEKPKNRQNAKCQKNDDENVKRKFAFKIPIFWKMILGLLSISFLVVLYLCIGVMLK